MRNHASSLKSRGIWLLTAALLLAGLPAAAVGQSEHVVIGALAHRGKAKALEDWGPTAEHLSRVVPGYTFSILPLDFDEINPTVERGAVDFIITNATMYVELETLYDANRISTLRREKNG